MADIKRIALLGTGLIGGSLGLAWNAQRPELHLIGYDTDPDTRARAVERGAVDEATDRLEAAVAEVDLVVLATPLAALLRLIDAIAPLLSPGTLVTDVGSVKGAVADQTREILPETVRYIGGHPMAGSEHSGIAHADPFLFENATYVLCPPSGRSREDFLREHAAFVDLIRATGARPLLLSAERHDRIAAAVSHLPQLLAVTLARLAGSLDDDAAATQLAAGGFRDMTRIASSPFALWKEILIANHGPVLDVLGRFATDLQRLRNRLATEDLDAVAGFFEAAHQTREAIPRRAKGFLHPLSDLYVYAEDRPGALARMTGALYEAGLNIKDLELLRAREDTGGVFRLGLSSPSDREKAQTTLEEAGFKAQVLDEDVS